ncbi:MAG: cytochrome P450 [Planctomycetales bacterium]|nr:cytochrome P450 [Planctomycetales bacterium]
MARNPFGGDVLPTRVPLFWQRGRPTLPFPHRWNFQRPLDILEAYFWRADAETGAGRHNRYLAAPGFAPVLVTRDPGVIRAILTATGDRDDQFDRDTLPSTGIARATGEDTLLFGNGVMWRQQRKASAAPFGKTALFQVEVFQEFQETLRRSVTQRLMVLRRRLIQSESPRLRAHLEPEIKTLLLEMLVECFFGASIEYYELRDDYVPALERIIDHIVRDTVTNRLGLSRKLLGRFSRRYAQVNRDFETFERLTDRVMAARSSGNGLWPKLRLDAPNEALRNNIKVFLAGALEATTSYATWAISHLARNAKWQEKVFLEVESMAEFSPEQFASARSLAAALEETLRLTPSLYFLPRKATRPTQIETSDGRTMQIPQGTHILLDVWHANRHPDHWGESATGRPADKFAPERWEKLAEDKSDTKEHLHFGFGHGSRVCPGKHLGQLEVSLVVGVFVKLFRFRAVHPEVTVKAGVSTKPADGTLLEMELREPSAGMTKECDWASRMEP